MRAFIALMMRVQRTGYVGAKLTNLFSPGEESSRDETPACGIEHQELGRSTEHVSSTMPYVFLSMPTSPAAYTHSRHVSERAACAGSSGRCMVAHAPPLLLPAQRSSAPHSNTELGAFSYEKLPVHFR